MGKCAAYTGAIPKPPLKTPDAPLIAVPDRIIVVRIAML